METEARARAALGATASGDSLLFMGRTEYVVRAMDVATGAERWNVTYAKLEMLHGAGDGTRAPQLLGQVRPLAHRVPSLSLASLTSSKDKPSLVRQRFFFCLLKLRANGSILTYTLHSTLATLLVSVPVRAMSFTGPPTNRPNGLNMDATDDCIASAIAGGPVTSLV